MIGVISSLDKLMFAMAIRLHANFKAIVQVAGNRKVALS
jgi:hypothetical protein